MVEDASENRTERQAEICGGNGESEHFASHLGRKRGYEDRYICGKDHRRAHTLQQPEGDDRLNVPRQRAQQSEDGKQNLACYQNRLFAVQVREVSERDGERGGRQDISRNDPAYADGSRMKFSADGRNGKIQGAAGKCGEK